mgnify:CR=1 FL=1
MNYDITVMPKHEPEKITTDAPQKPGALQTGLDSPILSILQALFSLPCFWLFGILK